MAFAISAGWASLVPVTRVKRNFIRNYSVTKFFYSSHCCYKRYANIDRKYNQEEYNVFKKLK